MASTRQQLRQEIGRLTGDMLKCTATANGTTTSFTDALRLVKGNGSQEGRIGWVASGTSANLYQMVRVSGNIKQTATVQFENTPLPSSTATGDVIELWNERGQGFFPDDVNTEINTALAIVANKVTEPDEEIITTFDYDDPYIDIPADWVFYGALLIEDANGLWYEFPSTEGYMDIDTHNRTIRLKGEARTAARDNRVKLVGDVPSSPLTLDTQSTSCYAEWLTTYVAYRLLFPNMKRVSRDAYDDASTRMAFAKTTEEKTRNEARNRPVGIGLRLW